MSDICLLLLLQPSDLRVWRVWRFSEPLLGICGIWCEDLGSVVVRKVLVRRVVVCK